MRVLLVVHGFPPAAHGGTELYAAAQARALRHQFGDDVAVLTREHDTTRPELAVRRETCDGIHICSINNTYRTVTRFADTYDNRPLGAVAERLIDELAPDAAHIHHLTHLSTTILRSLAQRSIPSCLTLHDYWLLCHRGQLLGRDGTVCEGPSASDGYCASDASGPQGCTQCIGPAEAAASAFHRAARLARALESRSLFPAALRHAGERIAASTSARDASAVESARRAEHMREACAHVTHFFAPSRAIRDRFVRFGVPAEKITWSPYGIDVRRFATVTRTTSTTLRIAFIGTLMASKAPHLVVEAAGRMPPGRVTVDVFGAYAPYHGDDSYRAVVERALDRPFVTAHGPIAAVDVPQALAAVDVLIVPSIWPENSPFVIHEAFAAGVPVIGSRIGGIPELIEDGTNGLLFSSNDAGDLAAKLQRLLDDGDLLDRLRAGRPAVRTIAEDVRFTRSFYGRDAAAPPGAPGEGRALRDARVAAIVVNYRTPEQTRLAVHALLASARPLDDVIVIDNDAGRAAATLAPAAPNVAVASTGRNLGFSGGFNAGIARARASGADLVLLVNSDALVPPDCLDQMIDVLAERPCAGIVGPLLLARSDPDRIASAGLRYHRASGRMRQVEEGMPVAGRHFPRRIDVDAVSGAVMLVRRAVFDAIGVLDEQFFFGFEDLEFCLRASDAGFASVVAGRAVAYHEVSGSIGSDSAARLYFAARNHLLLARRLERRPGGFAAAARTAGIVMLNAAHAVRARPRALPSRLEAVARGVRDYALGRFGPGPQIP